MGRKNKYKKKKLSDERLAELRGALDAGEHAALRALGDDEMAALAGHLSDKGSEQVSDDQAAAWLVELQGLIESKAQRKAVNKALYRLERRGVEVPTWRERPEGIDLVPAAEPVEDLPVMLNEPSAGGTRHLLMPHQSGRVLKVVQVQLREPAGLAQLRAGEVNRRGYRDLVKRLIGASIVDGSPAAVAADDAYRRRKLWEVGQLVHTNRTGSEIDADLVSELRWPDEAPRHPIWDLDLAAAEPLDDAELTGATRLAIPFISSDMWDKVEAKMAESEASPLILSAETEQERTSSAFEKVVSEVVDEALEPLDPATFVEFALDVALFHGLIGNVREARTVRDALAAVAPPDEPAETGEAEAAPADNTAGLPGLRTFVVRLASRFFAQGVLPDEPDPAPEGGLVVP